ncbi:protein STRICTOSIDINE SYNTHASE-LIKE 6-like [Nicotiana tomentosiformis]|uniref:protein STRICTOSIDINE SYNTHASE-LIKE 6-like n=1 Tax=Nicotiana tomentosiformis TaxID=4098 RepID=UPI00051BA67C|nr:protein STRICTOSIDINE SYNTHASE-LIKE 6-like [Nicotiana tomentosiformis]
MPNSSPTSSSSTRTVSGSWPIPLFISVLIPVILGVVLYQLESFDPASYPIHVLSSYPPMIVPKRNNQMLRSAEKIGVDRLLSPEDVAYDLNSGVIYTGCVDGWVKRVTVNESVGDSRVENWVFTGGRPLGVALGHYGEVIVVDADKGLLLNVTSEGEIKVLTEEAEGLKLKLADAVDIAENGMIYFSDASYKYNFKDYIYDFLEGRPYGRLLSYDPLTKQTKTLLRDLYFANGVAVSPDQNFVIICETPLRKCKKYYINGERKGSVDVFVENLPGYPDNIRYDGDGHYWIAFATAKTYSWDLAQRYPFIRKIMAIMVKYIGQPHAEKNGGVISVDLQGNPVEHYYDRDLTMVSSATKIGEHLYCGSVKSPYMLRLNLKQNPAVHTS